MRKCKHIKSKKLKGNQTKLFRLGTQVVLCNPVCFVAYTLASWSFFNERIHEEEIALIHFFGNNYIQYQQKVGTGLPFISGFKLNENIAQ